VVAISVNISSYTCIWTSSDRTKRKTYEGVEKVLDRLARSYHGSSNQATLKKKGAIATTS